MNRWRKLTLPVFLIAAAFAGWRWWTFPRVDWRLVGGWQEVRDTPSQWSPPHILYFGRDGRYCRDDRVRVSYYRVPVAKEETWGVQGAFLIRRFRRWSSPPSQKQGMLSEAAQWASMLWTWVTNPSGRPRGALYSDDMFQTEIVSLSADKLVLRDFKQDGTPGGLVTTYRRIENQNFDWSSATWDADL